MELTAKLRSEAAKAARSKKAFEVKCKNLESEHLARAAKLINFSAGELEQERSKIAAQQAQEKDEEQSHKETLKEMEQKQLESLVALEELRETLQAGPEKSLMAVLPTKQLAVAK